MTGGSAHTIRGTLALFALIAASGPLQLPAMAQDASGLQAAAAIERATVDAIARCERSVVAIARVRRDQLENLGTAPAPESADFVPNEYGTGVVIDRQGLILTNAHVLGPDAVEDSQYFVTTSDRKTYRATVKGADPRSDLAVLEIPASDLMPIKFGNAKTLKKGQIVIALGNPYAIARDGQVSASWGIIANLSRKLSPSSMDTPGESKSTLHHFGTLIQTDAKLNLGTSGGALVNLKGEMVGLTTSIAATAGYEQAAGYAIPIDDTFLRVIETLKQGREVEYGFLGVSPLDLPASTIIQGGFGAQISGVVPGTPADRADVRRGDIVLAVDGRQVFNTDDLMLSVGKLPVESIVTLTVLRDGRTMELKPQLSKFPVRGRKIVTAEPETWRGIQVDYATLLLDASGRSVAPLGEEGVVVTHVAPGSPAAAAGVRPNMLITHVQSTPVRSPREFLAAVRGHEQAVELRISSEAGRASKLEIAAD